MNALSKHGIDYTDVPADFPSAKDDAAARWADWGVCDELSRYLARECLDEKARAHRAERPVDILLKSYLRAAALGWGEPDELSWVFRRVAELLEWPAPAAVRRP